MDKGLFTGSAAIAGADLSPLEVANGAEAVDEALRRFDWAGLPAGCVVLQLSPDNSSVASGLFAARGALQKEYKIEAAKIWASADPGLLLTAQVPDASHFVFTSGGLASDYLDMGDVEHCVTTTGRNPQLLLQSHYKDKGVGNFCVRLVCSIQKASARHGVTLGFTVLIYPGSSEELLNMSDLANSPSWPGLKMADGEMALLPLPTSPWGCPLLPLLLWGATAGANTNFPSMDELREKIGWLMTTSEPADCCKTRKALMSKWERFCNNPDDFTSKKSQLTWPKPPQHTIQGE
jgi:hypothetical protein